MIDRIDTLPGFIRANDNQPAIWKILQRITVNVMIEGRYTDLHHD
jgi:hypothetical protein